ncbi:MAG: hypothetical protein HOB58_03315, partial [Nitrospina sp.]|nr:hypothetical protein [Nitrospina sp.]
VKEEKVAAEATDTEPSEDEEDEEDDEDDEDDEVSNKKSKKRKKMIAVGCVAALLLTSGGLYFGWKTLAPKELVEMGKLDTAVPEELTPKPKEGTEIEEQEDGEDLPDEPQGSEGTSAPKENRPTGTLGGEEDTNSELAKELSSSEAFKSLGIEGDFDPGPAIDPEELKITLSSIMPVAFNATDIRVLSFKLTIETFDKPSAQLIKKTLPIYEKATIKTVELFLKNKFYNDIFYVKEKLQRRLQKSFESKMESSGRIKKLKFAEFLVK